jgi:geranylgeranyl diphosphate synthase, type II
MHIHKTGALIRASVTLGALSQPNIDPAQLETLEHFANCMGLAFQIRDDILDVEGDTETLGKPQGSDEARHKATYPALLGMNEAKRRADELYAEAVASLSQWGKAAQPLRDLAEYIIHRQS